MRSEADQSRLIPLRPKALPVSTKTPSRLDRPPSPGVRPSPALSLAMGEADSHPSTPVSRIQGWVSVSAPPTTPVGCRMLGAGKPSHREGATCQDSNQGWPVPGAALNQGLPRVALRTGAYANHCKEGKQVASSQATPCKHPGVHGHAALPPLQLQQLETQSQSAEPAEAPPPLPPPT